MTNLKFINTFERITPRMHVYSVLAHVLVSHMYHTLIHLRYVVLVIFIFIFLGKKCQYIQDMPVIQFGYCWNPAPDSERYCWNQYFFYIGFNVERLSSYLLFTLLDLGLYSKHYFMVYILNVILRPWIYSIIYYCS